MCQQGRRTRLAIDFSTGHTCVSHASGVLGVCMMITSALLRTETERWREESHLLSSSVVYPGGFLAGLAGLAWHDALGHLRVPALVHTNSYLRCNCHIMLTSALHVYPLHF